MNLAYSLLTFLTELSLKMALIGLLLSSESYARLSTKVTFQSAATNFSLKLYQKERYQIIEFHGGFNKENPYKIHRGIINKLIPQKDILLILKRGYGGSVKDHKKFASDLKNQCRDNCQIITYLDGKCSSMCTTLYLSGDVRLARKDESANLAFHRTLIKVGNRNIPIQTVKGMVRYFSKFRGVQKDYLQRNRERLFKTEGNQLSHVHSDELLEAGFSQELLKTSKDNFQSLFRFLGIE